MYRQFPGLLLIVLTLVFIIATDCHSSNKRSAKGIHLIESGKPTVTLVLPDAAAADEQLAAKELAEHIRKACGTEPPVVTESNVTSGRCVYVGSTQLSQSTHFDFDSLDGDGFLITTIGESIVIRGATPQGTLFGVYRFLHKYMGVRWYMPTELGEHVPHRNSLAVGEIRLVEEPDVLSRAWSGADKVDKGVWERRNLMGQRMISGHTCYSLIPAKLFDDHPDWFPMYSGVRYKPHGETDYDWQPCMTSIGLATHIASAAREDFDKNPDKDYFCVGMNDSTRYCECTRCSALMKQDGVHGSISTADSSDLVFTFLNNVARELKKTHPDKYITTLAYAGCERPPSFAVSPRIIPFLAIDTAEFYDPQYKATVIKLIESWSKAVPQIAYYDYYYGYTFVIPRVYTQYSIKSLKLGRQHHLAGFYGEIYSNWALDGPKAWLASQLLWDADQDTDKLLDDYYENMFAEAAVPMRQYFELCERQWMNQPGTGRIFRLLSDPAQLAIFPPDACRKALALLSDAERLARSDVVRERVLLFTSAFKLTAMYSDLYHGERALLATDPLRGAKIDDTLVELGRLNGVTEHLVRYYRDPIAKNDLTKSLIGFSDYAGGTLPSVVPTLAVRSFGTDSWSTVRAKLKQFSAGAGNREISETVDACIHLLEEPTSGVEALSNGGFEAIEAGLPAEWGVYYGDPTQTEVLVSTEDKRSGEYGIRIAPKGSVRGSGTLTRRIRVRPGEVYVLTVYVKGKMAAGNATGINLWWLDDKETWINDEPGCEARLSEGTTDDWVPVSLVVKVPEKAGYLALNIGSRWQQPGDYAFFDDASMKRVVFD